MALLSAIFSLSRTLDIRDYGAVAGTTAGNASVVNCGALTTALNAALPGDTVLVTNGSYYCRGGLALSNLRSVTLQLDGTLIAAAEYDDWPVGDGSNYDGFLTFSNADNLTIRGAAGAGAAGVSIDGRGKGWWNRAILPQLFGKLKGKRPKLLKVINSTRVVVERLTMLNSPSFHLLLTDVAHVEVGWVNITVDRAAQAPLRDALRVRRLSDNGGDANGFDGDAHGGGDANGGLEIEDLNTDGIDPSGRDVWVHDSYVLNDDDSIAVKPCSADKCEQSGCSQDMLFERLTLTGVGASIGSVPPHAPSPHCVRNITFRGLYMPQTAKGIYIKSNPSCGGAHGANASAIVEDILYEDIHIVEPRWWAVWIGPQQQQEPGVPLGEKCALDYPLQKHCPTQGCVTMRNITLRNVRIERPLLSPGVILGNASNPIGLAFENVTVDAPGAFPFGKGFECEHASGTAAASSPVPPCLTPR